MPLNAAPVVRPELIPPRCQLADVIDRVAQPEVPAPVIDRVMSEPPARQAAARC
jgi:hypothetical protein